MSDFMCVSSEKNSYENEHATVNMDKGDVKLKVSTKAFERSMESLRKEERNINRLSIRLETLQDGFYSQCVSETIQQRIRLIQESLQTNRKQIYEIIYSLDRIWDLYQKYENDLFEECQDAGTQRIRTAISVTLNFTKEEMQLIDLIKL